MSKCEGDCAQDEERLLRETEQGVCTAGALGKQTSVEAESMTTMSSVMPVATAGASQEVISRSAKRKRRKALEKLA